MIDTQHDKIIVIIVQGSCVHCTWLYKTQFLHFLPCENYTGSCVYCTVYIAVENSVSTLYLHICVHCTGLYKTQFLHFLPCENYTGSCVHCTVHIAVENSVSTSYMCTLYRAVQNTVSMFSILCKGVEFRCRSAVSWASPAAADLLKYTEFLKFWNFQICQI